jgi:phosphomannomutase
VSPRDAALEWIAGDPDPTTRAELQGALDEPVLAELMGPPLRFGTAGLRGPLRPGPAGMNVATVRRATFGLATWLAADGHGGRPVVVGRDARHGSERFAAETAGVLAAAGFAVHVLPGPLPTPLLAYSVRTLGAAAGIQITASHNPAQDNGYKVYLADGAQLVPPADAEIEAAIAAAPPAVDVETGGPVRTYDPTEDYLARAASLGRPGRLRIALSPMHGVGGKIAVEALARAGFPDVHLVPEQADPDPDFPTVAFPNPEEPGATDLLLALAERIDADLAIALDPDADRCALGIPGHGMLTGDQTGALLGDHLLRSRKGLVATTIVSSGMLSKIAAAHGVPYAETLTGFKWIVRAGAGFTYGYEEALGYCVDPEAVRDKDGISAAVVAASLAAEVPLLDRLAELERAHGRHRTAQIALRTTDPVLPAPLPGWRADRPAPDVLRLRRANERIIVRPSGTEPKIKAYLEIVGDGSLAELRAEVAAWLSS